MQSWLNIYLAHLNNRCSLLNFTLTSCLVQMLKVLWWSAECSNQRIDIRWGVFLSGYRSIKTHPDRPWCQFSGSSSLDISMQSHTTWWLYFHPSASFIHVACILNDCMHGPVMLYDSPRVLKRRGEWWVVRCCHFHSRPAGFCLAALKLFCSIRTSIAVMCLLITLKGKALEITAHPQCTIQCLTG